MIYKHALKGQTMIALGKTQERNDLQTCPERADYDSPG